VSLQSTVSRQSTVSLQAKWLTLKTLYSQGYREDYVLKIIIFWTVTPEDGGNKLLRNFGTYIPIYLKHCLRRLE